mmetsp:Transcript_41933/g.135260  ORF Transcript_41933/g.135260 Transcript_41933/m.135260 type:complete len:201 (+) Transcript_41933:364-966(+)
MRWVKIVFVCLRGPTLGALVQYVNTRHLTTSVVTRRYGALKYCMGGRDGSRKRAETVRVRCALQRKDFSVQTVCVADASPTSSPFDGSVIEEEPRSVRARVVTRRTRDWAVCLVAPSAFASRASDTCRCGPEWQPTARSWYSPSAIRSRGVTSKKWPKMQPLRTASFSCAITIGSLARRAARTCSASASAPSPAHVDLFR